MNNQFQNSISKFNFKSQIQKSISIFLYLSRKDANKIGVELCVFARNKITKTKNNK